MMPKDQLNRKLAVILHADIVGFSRLSGDDEEGTYRRLREYLDFFSETIRAHDGHVVNTAGDAILADFPMASRALACAVEVQRALENKNQSLPQDQRMLFRIGINLGEVIAESDDIHGDGVNVAARLQGLAAAGGICISEAVHAAIGHTSDFTYHDLGEQQLKNITEPLHAYQVLPNGGEVAVKSKFRFKATMPMIAAGLAVCLILVGAGWFVSDRLEDNTEPPEISIKHEKAIPSIAVLPFQNIGGNPKENYFIDGITQDVITDLSRFSNLFVIAANSVFVYKGKAVDIKIVGRDLGVRYILEGSVQRVGDRVRMNAQLIEVKTNHHIWATRYDREMVDIFAVQDELTKSIVAELRVALTEVERARTARHYTNNLEAYDLFLRGRSYLRGSKQTHLKARSFFDRAIALDPKFAAAHAEKSMTYFSGFIMPMSRDPKVIKGSLVEAERAVALNPDMPLANARLGWALFANRRHEEAIAAGRRAVALGPSDAESHAQLGNILNWTGRPKEAIPYLERAMRLNPHYPFYYRFYLGHSHYLLKNRERAIELFERVVTRAPYFLPVRRHLAVLYEEVGESGKAKAQTKEVLRIFPGASIEDERERCFYMWEPALQKRFFDGLKKSEMPQGKPGKDPVDM